MTVEKAIEILSDVGDINRCCAEDAEALDMAIKALEQEPCEDCISRKDVLDMATSYYTDGWNTTPLVVDVEDIEELPSVTPKAEQKWIPCTDRLPEPNRLVLCYITTGASATYFLALWNDTQNAWEEGIGGCRLLENDLGYEVIAWMPLPESYKKNNEFSM